jgi:putative FmdB family regulatory protein
MPIHEYRCPECEKVIEVVSLSTEDNLFEGSKKDIVCNECQIKMNKLISAPGKRYRYMDTK